MAGLLIRKVGVVIPLTTLIMIGLLSEEKIKYVWWVYMTYAVIATLMDVISLVQVLKTANPRSSAEQMGGTEIVH